MTLGVALSNALSGLNVVQSALATTSNNITNASTPGYNRKVIENVASVTDGRGTGATANLKRVVDDFLIKSVRDQQSANGRVTVRLDYMDRLQSIFGQPDSGSTIMDSLDNFYGAMANLAASPEQPYFRTQAVQSANTLSTTISSITQNLQKLRLESDRSINDATSNLNNALDRLSAINTALREASNGRGNSDELLDQRDSVLNEVLGYADMGVSFKGTGEVILYTQQADILNGDTRYHFEYIPAGSIANFTNDTGLGTLKLVGVNEDNSRNGEEIALSSGTTASTYTTVIGSGQIKGLLEVRDLEIPRMLEQMDALATGLRDTMNALHNLGTGYPPPQTLTGTTLTTGGSLAGMSGEVMIAVINSDGTPITSPYGNDSQYKFKPLTLNFDKIYGANGWGEPTMAEVTKEINQYYDSPSPRAAFGPLKDLRLVAMSDNTTGPFQFDFEMENGGAEDLDITIVSIEAAAVGDTISIGAGEMDRSGPTNTYSVAGAGPYSIDVVVQFTDPATGNVYNETITYDVPAAASGLRSNRYGVTSMAGGTGTPPDGSIVTPTSNAVLAVAQLVTANGTAITPSDTATLGYLKLSAGNTTYGISINEISSVHETTGRAFSHQFGMNNLYVENSSTALGSDALNMAVRSDIKTNPNRFAAGGLSLSLQPTGAGAEPLYTYELSIGSNATVSRLANMQETSIAFVGAGTLPAYTNTATAYASEIYSYVGGLYNNAGNEAKQQQLISKTYEEKLDNVSGVNIDEELANTVLFQNAYSASARIITVVSTLFDVLLEIRS